MAQFEYKVVPAPVKPAKVKGMKRADERFAKTLGDVMNTMATEGWEYLRAEALPCEERKGLMGRTATVFVNLLVFRRQLAAAREESPVAPPEVTAQAAEDQIGEAQAGPALSAHAPEGSAPRLSAMRNWVASEPASENQATAESAAAPEEEPEAPARRDD